jgi:hypothetical protein
VGKLFGLGMRFSKSCNKWLKLVSDHPFLAVEVPFWVVVRRRRMLTVRARRTYFQFPSIHRPLSPWSRPGEVPHLIGRRAETLGPTDLMHTILCMLDLGA